MVAYPALLNPRFFRGGERADGVALLHEYLSYVERYPAQSKTIKSSNRSNTARKSCPASRRSTNFKIPKLA